MMKEKTAAFERLLKIMDELREKCPWDRKQTFDTLRYLTIEETYELSDAIIEKQYEDIKKEVGDLLLHIVFYGKIGEEQNRFDIADIINSLCEKLIRRHPHIYGDEHAATAEEVKNNWEAIKMKEGRKSVLSGVPKSLPSMVKAIRMQEKARGVGFDWDTVQQVEEKVHEEWRELQSEIQKNNNQDAIEGEFGDLLFALINYARFIGVNPEDALEHTNKKFIRRFSYVEDEAHKRGKELRDMTLEEMDVYWNEAKNNE